MHGDNWWNVFLSFPLGIDDRPKKQAQWWFVNSYFVMWNYIIAGIVQGYIVDAFGAIRGAQDERNADAQTKCLVCSLDKFDLDRAGVDFEVHTEDQHNRWGYVYAASAVHGKPPDEHCTTESVVCTALDKVDTKFLPLETCVHMELATKKKKKFKLEDEVESRLARIEQQLAALVADRQ